MAVQFSSQNLSGFYVPGVFESVAKKILYKIEKITKKKWGEVSLVFIRPQRIKQLNSVYHYHDEVTDILSFTYKKASPINGEIFICVRQAKRQADFFKRSLLEELEFLFIHGCLHLQGYDHIKPKDRKIMEDMENIIYGNKRN